MVVQGRAVVPLDVWAALEQLPATEDGVFQIVRPAREVDELRIRVGYREALVPSERAVDQLGEEVRHAVHAQTGIKPEVELLPDGQLLGKGHKVVRVVKA
jgi:phenylacetate-CoA ligase